MGKPGSTDGFGGTPFIERHLRSGVKRVPLKTKRKRQLRKKDAIIPPQPNRTSLDRKAMTTATTEMIAGAAHESREQQHATAAITDWTSVSAFCETPEYSLKDNNTARCHILADSNVKIILAELIGSLRSAPLEPAQKQAVAEFIESLNSREASKILLNIETLGDPSGHMNYPLLNDTAHRLSHGQENLFFGNATRNEFVLTGLDVPFVDGRPDRRAMRIRYAVVGLAYQRLITLMTALNATSPTYDRRDGLAVSSSSQTRYDPMEVFGSDMPSLKRKREEEFEPRKKSRNAEPSSSDF